MLAYALFIKFNSLRFKLNKIKCLSLYDPLLHSLFFSIGDNAVEDIPVKFWQNKMKQCLM